MSSVFGLTLQPGQPLPGILNFGQAGVGVFPEVEEFSAALYSFGSATFFLKYCIRSLKAE